MPDSQYRLNMYPGIGHLWVYTHYDSATARNSCACRITPTQARQARDWLTAYLKAERKRK